MTRGWFQAQVGSFSLEVDWSVDPGKVLVLFGPSGAGKTATLRSIAGLVRPYRGKIEVGGAAVFDSELGVSLPPHLRRIGYVPQDWLVFPHLDVASNIGYGLRGWDAGSRQQRIAGLIERLGLGGLEQRRAWQLSGGQMQRVALARALAPQPQVLLLDEPFSALDVETRRQVRSEVRAVLKEAGIPVVLVTHDREEALVLGDQVAVIDQGRLIEHGEPVAVLGHPPRERVARLVGVENLLDLRVAEVLPVEGIMRCERGAFRLEVPLSDAHVDEEITVGLRADDVLLSAEHPHRLSARNAIAGTVASLQVHGTVYEVTVDCDGVAVVSHVTHRAVEDLGIAEGERVWAVVKTTACTVLAA